MRRRPIAVVLGGIVALSLVAGAGVMLQGQRVGLVSETITEPGAATSIRPDAIRVTDGDTIRLAGGERIRILNVDTPEMGSRARCRAEALLALEARRYLVRRVRQAQRIEVAREGRDRFGRTLARVRIDGQDIGEELVRNRLAQPWRGHRVAWCDVPTEWDRP